MVFFVCVLSHVSAFATLWTVVCQAPLSMGFSRQEYWSGLPFPTPGDLSNPGIKPTSPKDPALAGGLLTTEPPGKPMVFYYSSSNELHHYSYLISVHQQQKQYNVLLKKNATIAHINENKFILPSKKGKQKSQQLLYSTVKDVSSSFLELKITC